MLSGHEEGVDQDQSVSRKDFGAVAVFTCEIGCVRPIDGPSFVILKGRVTIGFQISCRASS